MPDATFNPSCRLKVGMDLTGVLLGYQDTLGSTIWVINNLGSKSWSLGDEFEWIVETTPTTWRMIVNKITGGSTLQGDTGAQAWSLVKGNPPIEGVNQWVSMGDSNSQGTRVNTKLTQFSVANF